MNSERAERYRAKLAQLDKNENGSRGLIHGLLISAGIWGLLIAVAVMLMGCASINEAYMKAYVAIHDAADKAMDQDKGKTNAPVVAAPVPTPEAPVIDKTTNDIKPFAGKYSQGSKGSEYGEEIWVHNWERMNIRIHANAGELKGEGIPTQGPWYPILASVIPAGAVTMQKTADGCALTARDFVSSNGQAYRFEGWRCDGLGSRMQKVYTVVLKQNEMNGGQFAWYATVEK